MRAALLCVTSDLPALRKITQFLGHKADLGCTRCKFHAEREPGTRGASGRMSYYTGSNTVARNHSETVAQANEHRLATSKSAATIVAQKNGVRYSELVRLPYFNIVRMATTDPMHTFLLGMVKNETKLNLQLLISSQYEVFLKRVKSVRMPYDIGRLPTNAFDVNEGKGMTADQWKTYITCYARPCLYKLLPLRAYKSLVLLSEVVSIIVSPCFTDDTISSLYRLLHEHHQQFCRVYGRWSVTVNYHMALHLPEIISDLGPPHVFWCFCFERINGALAGSPNSNRCIEMEVANRFFRSSEISISDIDIPGLPSTLTEFVQDENDTDEHRPFPQSFLLQNLLSNYPERESRFQVQQELDKGLVEDWPLEFKHPCKLNVRCEASLLKELSTFFEDLYGGDLEYIRPRINKYGRCQVNGQKFSSDLNSTDRGSIVKVMFADIDDELSPYFGIVRFYFTAIALVNQEPITHHLTYVTWLKFRNTSPDPLCHLYGVSKEVYQKDRIISPRRFLCRCVMVRINPAVPFFLVSELTK